MDFKGRRREQPEPEDVIGSSGGWLGIRGLSITPEIAAAIDVAVEQEGVLVEEVILNSPADSAGLRGGDTAVEVNGNSILAGGDIIIAFGNQSVSLMEELQEIKDTLETWSGLCVDHLDEMENRRKSALQIDSSS